MDMTELLLELRDMRNTVRQINDDREREYREKRDRRELWDEIHRLKKVVKQLSGGEHE